MEKRENKRSLPTTGLATSREKREREKKLAGFGVEQQRGREMKKMRKLETRRGSQLKSSTFHAFYPRSGGRTMPVIYFQRRYEVGKRSQHSVIINACSH